MKTKKIKINNKKDYNKFLQKLFLYKSIFYYNTLFKVDTKIDDKMLTYIIEALNIKNRKRRITYIYDNSCKMIDDSTPKNMCGFKNGKCYLQRSSKSKNCNGCCGKCLYQSKEGCPTKNLACKLFNCSEVKSRYNMIRAEDLKLLRLLSLKNQLIIKSDYFSTREDVLKDLYAYTLTYSTIRVVYRLIKNNYLLKKDVL